MRMIGFWISIIRDVAAPPGDATWIVPAQSGNPWCPLPGTAESSIKSRHLAAGSAGGLWRCFCPADGLFPWCRFDDAPFGCGGFPQHGENLLQRCDGDVF